MKNPAILSLHFIVVAFLIIQSSCTDDNESNPNPDVTASSYSISGTVKFRQVDTSGTKLVDWHFGPGMLRVLIGGENVAVAAMQSDGNFTVILPATVSGDYFSDLSDIAIIQGGTIKVTPETGKYVNSTKFMVDYTENDTAKSITVNHALLNYNLTTYRNYYYYFYDNEGSLVGTSSTGNAFNWVFNKGWGMVESNMNSGTTFIISSKSVDAAPDNAVWSN